MANPIMTTEEEQQALADQITHLASQGLPVAVDPDVADAMGAFADDALTLEDALESRFDDVVEDE